MNKSQEEYIVIVDGFSNGIAYAPAFLKYGYRCIHVNTGLFQLAESPSNISCYTKEIRMRDHKAITDIVDALKQYRIKAIVPGSEVGILATEAIQLHFNLPCNNLSMESVRRDKFLMIEALRRKNLPCAAQFKSESLDAIINWYKQSRYKKIVLKPTLSTSSDGVALCDSVDKIRLHYSKFHNKINMLGVPNKYFVAQECLEGEEYIINSVSCRGKHFITDIWKGVGGLKDRISTDQYAELICRDSPEFSLLSQYVEQVLDAVGITNSPGHSEVKLTPDGPMLIEVAARLPGIIDFSVMHTAMHYSQLSLSVSSILFPQQFMTQINALDLSKQPYCRLVYFCSNVTGKIVNEPDFSSMMALDSVKSIRSKTHVGDQLLITNETFGRPGSAMLVSETAEKLEEDYQAFRALEQSLYQQIITNR